MAFVTHSERTAANGLPEGDGEFAATIEPRPGHTDDEVERLLGRAGAKRVTRIAPGFISAMATADILKAIVGVAFVELKKESKPTIASPRVTR